MQLSKRLRAVAKMVTPCHAMADIGTDHGYIPIYLVKEGIVSRALAMDVNIGPLKSANENIASYECESRIATRLSDGVAALNQDEVDAVVIAGMGGNLIMKILAAGEAVLMTVKELILQPQSEIAMVRKFLQENGYHIVAEDMVCEDEKYYPMMKVIHGDMNLKREIDFIYGPCLLNGRNPILKQFLQREQKTLEKIAKQVGEGKSTSANVRVQEIKQEMRLNEEARNAYE